MNSTTTITALRANAAPQFASDDGIALNHLQRHRSDNRSQFPISPEEEVSEDDNWDQKEGWPVVIAGSALFFVYLGLAYSYGIVQLHLERRRLANVPTLSFIGSVATAISPLTGPITARIIKRFGYRATAFTGSVMLGLGEFTAGWSTRSVPAMFMTQGVLFGIGAAMIFLPAATVPSLWFKRKRGLATGIVYGGAGIGAAVIALSLEKLVNVVGLETALKVLGALAWVVCIPASYFIRAPPRHGHAASSIPWRLFRSPKFILMLVMGAVATFPLFVPPFLLPLYVASVGLSGSTGAAMVAAWNLASAVGRIGMGFGADSLLGPLNSMFLSLVAVGISALALWPFASSLGMVVAFAVINGIGSGGFFSLFPVVVGSVFKDEQLATIMSVLSTSWFFGFFMGSPIAGYLLDAYGGTEAGLPAYRPAIFYAGSLTLTSAGLILAVRLMMNPKIFARV